jgi:hypothetical protein
MKPAAVAIVLALGAAASAAGVIALLDFRLGVPMQQGLSMVGVLGFAALAIVAIRLRSSAGHVQPTTSTVVPFAKASKGRPPVSVHAAILVRSNTGVQAQASKQAVGA